MKQAYLIAAIIALVLIVIIVGQRARINSLKADLAQDGNDSSTWYGWLIGMTENPFK